MDNIDTFYNSKTFNDHQVPSRIIGYQIVLIITLILLIILMFKFPITITKTYQGQVIDKEGEKYVSTYMEVDYDWNHFPKILNINNKKYEYQIIEVLDKYIIDNKEYINLILKIDLDTKYLLLNNIINLEIDIKKTKPFILLKEQIKKGMM